MNKAIRKIVALNLLVGANAVAIHKGRATRKQLKAQEALTREPFDTEWYEMRYNH